METTFRVVAVSDGTFLLRCTVCHGAYSTTLTGAKMAYSHDDVLSFSG